ncbi:MAG: peptidyl-alpha-hydroxyglycine alpha-amidating lyase family protein [Bryobacteraceae bacterium]
MTKTFCLLLAFVAAASAQTWESAGFLDLPKTGDVSAVAASPDGSLYVLQRGNPPVLKFDAKGKFVQGFGDGLFQVAHGLRVDRQGNVWTTDNANHAVRKFSPEGKLLLTLGQAGVAGNDPAHFRSPDDVVFNAAGDIYVADAGNARIVRLRANGTFIQAWGSKGKGPSQFALAHSLAIDERGYIYVGDRGNNRIQVFEPGGKMSAVFGEFGNPFGLLIADDQLFISDGDAHKILQFTLAGAPLGSWGTPETLHLPHMMTMDGKGTLYVAEVKGGRVQKFRKKN